MPELVFDYIAIWMGIPFGCAAAVVGWKMFLNHRRDILLGENASAETKSLAENVGALRDEVLCLHESIEEMRERLEFHERRLIKAEEESFSTPV